MANKTKLKRSQLLFYALPAVSLAMVLLPMQVLIPKYYAQEIGLSMTLVGAVLLSARILDVFTDPIIGYLSDHARGSFINKIGRRKLFVLLAFPIFIISTYFLFNPSDGADWLYLLLWSSLAYLSWTMAILPLETLGAEMSDDYLERNRPSHWREGLGLIGTIVVLLFIALNPQPMTSLSYAIIAIATVGFGAFLLLKENKKTVKKTSKISLKKSFKVLNKNKNFKILIASFLFNTTANSLPALLFFNFTETILNIDQNQSGELLFLYFLSALFAVPIWLWLSNRFDKKHVWSSSMIWAALIFCLVPFIGSDDYLIFLGVCLLTGVSLGADLAIPASMQADVIDYDRVETGKQRAGLYFALWSMCHKLSIGIAVGLAYPLLDFFNFSDQNNWPIYVFYAGVPIALKMISILIMQFYDLNKERVEKLQKEIQSL